MPRWIAHTFGADHDLRRTLGTVVDPALKDGSSGRSNTSMEFHRRPDAERRFERGAAQRITTV